MTDYAAKSADKKPSSRESTRYGSVASSGTASALAPVEFAVVSEDRRKDSFFFLTGLYSAVFLFLTASFPLYFYFTPDFSASDIR